MKKIRVANTMKKNYLLTMLSIVLISWSPLADGYTKRPRQALPTAEKRHALLDELYNEISGFHIAENEVDSIEKSGSSAVYGEITDAAVEKVLSDLSLKKNDVFYDLGSGVGRMAAHVYLASPVKKSVGVELSPTRHQSAIQVKNALKKRNLLDKNRVLDFYQDDLFNVDFCDATFIYLASTCFSDDFMQRITDEFGKLKKGVRILTLRKLPTHKNISFVKGYKLPMTWSEDVPAHLYVVD